MAQSLFDELRARNFQPPPPPRLKPTVLARLARLAWRNALLVVIGWSALAAMALGLAIHFAKAPMLELWPIPFEQAQAEGGITNFSRLDNLQTITLSNADPGLLDEQRADLVQTLRQHSEIYELVFAPGTGDYYDAHGLLYHPLGEIKGRVAYALSLKPLFAAVAEAPNANSMATLVNEVSNAIQQGRDPQGVDDLFSESAASVQALMHGEDKPVDWAKVADLDADNTAPVVTVLALPRPGQAAAASALTLRLLNVLSSSSQTVADLAKADDPAEKAPPLPMEWPRFFAALLIALVFSGLLLALALGRARMALVMMAPPLVMACAVAAGIAGAAGVSWLSFWPLGLGLVMVAGALSGYFVLAVVNQAGGQPAGEAVVMLAAQFHGRELLWLAGLMASPWVGLLVLGTAPTMAAGLAALALVGLALLCIFTLGPALLRYFPEASKWRASEWLVPAHRALFETGQWQWLARGLGALLVAASLAVIFIVPPAQVMSRANAPVTLIAHSKADAEAAINRLKSIPAALGVRWLAMFLPEAGEEKRAALQALKSQFPRITPVLSQDVADLRDELDTLQQSLKDISEAAAAKPRLKQAADEFRRSLALLAATSDDNQVRQLENRLFGGFNRLADRADVLANLDVPSLDALPSELTTLFGSPATALRIEVIPATNVSNGALAVALEMAGFNVLHPAVSQQMADAARLNRILMVLGVGLAIAAVLLMLAFGDAPPLTGAGLMMAASLIVLMAAERLWQSEWNLPWLLAVLAVLSSLMASLFHTPANRGSTALSAVQLFLLPAMALAIVLPFMLLNVDAVSEALLPPAVGLGLVAVVIGLLQQHRPAPGALDEQEWQDFQV
ncbi:MAG: hypothetical protein KGO53_07130 [Alphaproteobacteria bacterium]|nr:hypothetical protein [Alphaproteobacteria bacterium]